MGDGNYGLLRNDQTRRKTYDALKTMTQQLGAYRLVEQVAGRDHPATGVQAYLFESRAGHKLVAWNIEGPATVKLRSGSSAPVQIADHFGKAIPVEFLRDRPPVLPLSPAPVYVTGVGPGCSLEP